MSANINLNKDELRTLSEAAINHPSFKVRHCAMSLFWIYYGFSEKSLPTNMTRYAASISNWITNYEEYGIASVLRQEETLSTPMMATA
ncbi:MAG TPA: hypothetical protein ENI82_01875 [Bacteroidetes bacterium]|nr:hypothetical protein [Bacteroidota bacterium]